MSSTLTAIRDMQGPEQRFREMALLYSRFLEQEGIRVRPFHSSDLPCFSKLNAEQKNEAISQIASLLEIFEETQSEQGRLKDSPRLLWRTLRKLKWIPQPDIFDKIQDGDVVEIYSVEHKHIFQNLEFFNWVSHTLEEIYCTPWYAAVQREQNVIEAMYGVAAKLVSGEQTSTVDPAIPEHWIEEVGTELLLKYFLSMRFVSPLRADGRPVGYVVVWRARDRAEAVTS
jgi:hypothetical protein